MFTVIQQDPVREYSADAALTSVRTAHPTVLNDSNRCRVRRARYEASTPGVHRELTVCDAISLER